MRVPMKKRIHNRTKEECQEIAKGYSSVTEFRKENQDVYGRARRQGWINEITTHMIRPRKGSFTKEECCNAAKKYESRTEFETKDGFLFRKARKNKWLDEICVHLPKNRVGDRTKDDCLKVALQFSKRIDFFNGKRSVYYIASRNGWLDEICSHMDQSNIKSNIVYFWNVVGTNIWKIGVSNEDQVNSRIRRVANSHNVEVGQVIIVKSDNARKIETTALSISEIIPKMTGVDGYTEFRVMTDNQTSVVFRLLQEESDKNEKSLAVLHPN
jgi:hypothetical protein